MGPARAAVGQLVRVGARGRACRPPAVAVLGLRRSGRTGNGDSPCGRIAPACQAPEPGTGARRHTAHGNCLTARPHGQHSGNTRAGDGYARPPASQR